MINRATVDDAGCWLAGSSNRTADELSYDTVMIAKDRGFMPSDEDNKILERFANQSADPVSGVKWANDSDISDALNEISWDALGFLNAEVAPDGYVFDFDDGLYLFRDNEIDSQELSWKATDDPNYNESERQELER